MARGRRAGHQAVWERLVEGAGDGVGSKKNDLVWLVDPVSFGGRYW